MNVCRRQSSPSVFKCLKTVSTPHQYQQRFVSSSPYGRAHVWKRRAPVLPNPVVPKYPQTVLRSDGTSFVHWTTSPKSLVRLTRDTTNNPMYNPAAAADRSVEEESGTTGRLGRFSRRFEDLGSTVEELYTSGEMVAKASPAKKEVKKEAAAPAKKGGK
ncbi:hypothetical protein BKA70DRAFT_538064 [Coprinopsis sp. MPI-PUGE-AT-0042]|nr:hypothetical protein BKA70DRAFT_538064 [Coprinopsis sp. MPI-PUGE-AT-0042]